MSGERQSSLDPLCRDVMLRSLSPRVLDCPGVQGDTRQWGKQEHKSTDLLTRKFAQEGRNDLNKNRGMNKYIKGFLFPREDPILVKGFDVFKYTTDFISSAF